MKSRISTWTVLLTLFSIIGISASFMPWLYYPKADMSFYGYRADGVVTGFIFFLSLIFAIYCIVRGKLPVSGAIIFAILGFLMAYLSYYKITAIEAEKINFTTKNPLIAAASAGAEQGIGIYIFGIAGLGVFLTLCFYLYQQIEVKKEGKLIPFKKQWIYAFLIFLLLIIGLYTLNKQLSPPPNLDELKNTLTEEVSKMGKSLATEDYNTFLQYNHSIMVQAMGGKERVIDLARNTIDGLKEKNTTIKSVNLKEILDVKNRKKDIQILFTQDLILQVESQEFTENQKMIAVSEDNGKSWHFINISGKTKAEMTKFFPSLNQDLKF